jgi:hypothetical protein
MLNERGIRVPEALKNKIKRAAMMKNMTMIEYLETVIPDIEMVEVKK